RLFGFDQRSSRRWASGKRDVPYFLVIMLRMMVSGTINADDIERHMTVDRHGHLLPRGGSSRDRGSRWPIVPRWVVYGDDLVAVVTGRGSVQVMVTATPHER